MTGDRRKMAEARGRRAERMAALWLRCKGYRVLARGWRVPQGEIDLIARRVSTLAFVEVKARATREEALAAVTVAQQARIRAAAERFLATRPGLARLNLRFDVVLVRPGRLPEHLADAFR